MGRIIDENTPDCLRPKPNYRPAWKIAICVFIPFLLSILTGSPERIAKYLIAGLVWFPIAWVCIIVFRKLTRR